MTIVGGRQFDKNTGARRFDPDDLARQVATALLGRERQGHALRDGERVGRGSTRYGAGHHRDLIDMARRRRRVAAPNLVASPARRPTATSAMKEATALGGASSLHAPPAPERPRQRLDPRPAGLRLQGLHRRRLEQRARRAAVERRVDGQPAAARLRRLLGILCGGAGYVLHVGQGVTGKADPAHGRPETCGRSRTSTHHGGRARRRCPAARRRRELEVCEQRPRRSSAAGARDDFWEGDHPGPGAEQELRGDFGRGFVVMLTGVKSAGATGPVSAGTARACHVEAYDPRDAAKVVCGRPRAPGRVGPCRAWRHDGGLCDPWAVRMTLIN